MPVNPITTKKFRSARPWRTRQDLEAKIQEAVKFRSARPWRTRLAVDHRVDRLSLFRSARPWRTRPPACSAAASSSVFRSARPWRTRLTWQFVGQGADQVSIRAPVEDATGWQRQSPAVSCSVSIRAPVEDATSDFQATLTYWPGFDPRARGGRDCPLCASFSCSDSVSIRAPVEDATRFSSHFNLLAGFRSARPWRTRPPSHGSRPCWRGFDPRARGGRDRLWCTAYSRRRCFDPRARGGRDQKSPPDRRASLGFDPRARGGRDKTHRSSRRSTTVSIRAPVEDATSVKNWLRKYLISFDPRARGGRDPIPCAKWRWTIQFRSARPWRTRRQ